MLRVDAHAMRVYVIIHKHHIAPQLVPCCQTYLDVHSVWLLIKRQTWEFHHRISKTMPNAQAFQLYVFMLCAVWIFHTADCQCALWFSHCHRSHRRCDDNAGDGALQTIDWGGSHLFFSHRFRRKNAGWMHETNGCCLLHHFWFVFLTIWHNKWTITNN